MDFWQYLPVFRMAAEMEHMRGAAKVLRVSPSALSRSIGLLEESMGVALFERQGRNVRLSQAGRVMLRAVRSAMRLVDESLDQAQERSSTGPLRIHVPPYLVPIAADAAMDIQRELPDVVPCVMCKPLDDFKSLLSRGDLDLVLGSRAERDNEVDVVFIGRLSRSIYACRSHPIFSPSSGDDLPMSKRAFAQLSADMDNDDVMRFLGMPPVRFRTDSLSALIKVCCEGEYLSVLPDVAVEGMEELRPLAESEIAALPLYAVRRIRLVEEDLVDRALNAIIARLPEGAYRASE